MGKYSSVGFIRSDSKKKVRRTRVEREDRPGTAGYQTEHWSGRVDAVATPDAARGVGNAQE
jgi:hypothetical protein